MQVSNDIEDFDILKLLISL